MSFAGKQVLVLNTNWAAVAVSSLERAITLLFSRHNEFTKSGKRHHLAGQPKAKIVDPYNEFQQFTWEDWSKLSPKDGEDCIRGCSQAFKIPEVVLLTSYDAMPVKQLRFSRRTIYRRDNSSCQYCGKKVGNEGTIDHVLPRSLGGQTTWENCVLCCLQCNTQKADRLPQDAYKNGKNSANWIGPSPMKLLSIPKKPKFTLIKGRFHKIPKSWSHFLDEVYWNVELENDN